MVTKTSSNNHDVSLTLHEILAKPPPSTSESKTILTSERFHSVINFSNFLLHVLRVLTKKNIALDDKRLLEWFDKYLKDNSNNKIRAVQDFVFALLKCKFLFDQYIIKREFSDGKEKWSLKRLHFYNQKSQSYINTFDDSKEQYEEDGFEGINRQILMLLSAMHVSTPTLVYKHWLNGSLFYLFYIDHVIPSVYLQKMEELARKFVFCRFLSVHEVDYYEMIYQDVVYSELDSGNENVMNLLRYFEIKNNLVFNYLDYLLWCDGIKNSKDDIFKHFNFTFRSSVEHFYPQHPLDGYRKIDDLNLHRFGNLCLISHSKNSKLSNIRLTKQKLTTFSILIDMWVY